MRKNLFFHIGANKTGTTAIQYFLSANRKILNEDGYRYPGHQNAHHDIVAEFRTLTLPQIKEGKHSVISRYLEEIDNCNENNIILSSETFGTASISISLLKEFLGGRFRVKIIYYVRRQDDMLESLYNTRVKYIRSRYTKPFSEFIRENTHSMMNTSSYPQDMRRRPCITDYYSVLLPWAEAFGRENIIVRCYEKEQLPRGIFQDFLDSIGITLDERYQIPHDRINESLGWDLVEMIRICNIHFRDNVNFHKHLLINLNNISKETKKEKQHLLSPQQRRDLITLFEESNAKVAHEYLGRSDGRLFYAPLPDLNEPWTPHEGLTAERIVPIFAQILVNQDKRIKNIEERSLKRRMMKTIKKIGSMLGGLPALKYWYNRIHRF
jgi:hypothetical protein